MRKTLRTYLVGLCAVVMTINPVLACNSCGGGRAGGWGGGYRYSGPVYYGPMNSSCCGGCNGCGSVVVVDDCCGGCNSCGATVSSSSSMSTSHEASPKSPAEHSMQKKPAPVTGGQPLQVERPIETPPPVLQETPVAVPPAGALPDVPLPNNEGGTPPPPAPPAPPQDDLFKSPPPEPAAPPVEKPMVTPPATPPAAPPEKAAGPADDLFGAGPAKSAEPAKTAEPVATPPATPPASTDDLFGPGPPKAAEPAAPAEKAVTPPATPPQDKPEEKEKKADDIFGASPAVLREPGGLASDELRLWVDNTGSFSCYGRLVSVLDGKVRLVKDNGRTTTVPLGRLSSTDMEFANRQASAQQATLLQTVQSMSAMPWMAN